MDNNRDYLNKSDCKDFTAYAAVRNVQREERQKLIDKLNKLAEKHGYIITSVIRLEVITN